MPYEITIPYGASRYASWSCRQPGCTQAAGRAFSPGDSPDELLHEAAAHVAQAGHPVTYFRGTRQFIEPLATE